jgi:hypothetical protein
MLSKLLYIAVILTAFMLPVRAEDVQEKHLFCQAVAGNVMTGFDLKGVMEPAQLDEALAVYAMKLSMGGVPKFKVEQLLWAVQTGYAATKNANLLAEREYGRCMAQKET